MGEQNKTQKHKNTHIRRLFQATGRASPHTRSGRSVCGTTICGRSARQIVRYWSTYVIAGGQQARERTVQRHEAGENQE